MISKVVFSMVLLIASVASMTVLLNINPFKLLKKAKAIYFFGMAFILAESSLFLCVFSGKFSALYPLVVYLPIIYLFYKISHHSITKIFFVLLTAIFLAFPGLFLRKLINNNFDLPFIIVIIIYALVCSITVYLVWKLMRPDFCFALDNFSNKDVLKLYLVPIGYALIDYLFGLKDMRVSIALLQFVLFACTLGVYSLLLGTFRATKEINGLITEHAIMEEQLLSATKHLYDLRRSQEQAAIYRHDMRHHMALLNGYITDNSPKMATSYISQVVADIDAITPELYCENNTINLLLAFFVSKAKQADITLLITADAPDALPIADTALCAMISNGLENALNACSQVKEKANRKITFKCCAYTPQSSLLISIENNFDIAAAMLTQKNADHGFGTKSIKAITNRLGGVCTLTNDDKVFSLKIVLPLA